MATWQPPIPAGALYSKPARATGPALALLAYCYDLVQRDGWFDLNLNNAAGSMDEAYPTVKRWWQTIADGPFFAEVQNHGRKGLRVRFKDVWIEWRILKARETPPETFGTEAGSEMIPNTDSEPNRDGNEIIIGTETGSEMIPEQSGIKVLMTTDQADLGKALNAPRPEPAKRGKRDPNQQHPGCLVFYEKTGYRPNRQQAADIAATVTDLPKWENAVAAWLRKGKKITDADGMLDWYREPHRYLNGHTNGKLLRPDTGRHSERKPQVEADPERGF